ncbi:hypothetical protein [Methanogenium organophilum]|uniref:Uncharacterized protein n=1 Tax=Methanogenium organophilum TaxID=2199 RepID=A0A9X9T9B6_METOG|nr:hypothetical protein [Methanogenium organophilum]WAI02470.1 hypothetical protein OU421_06240 [Methanogenium organophilum]
MTQRYLRSVPAVLLIIMFIILPAVACHPVDDDDKEIWIAEYSDSGDKEERIIENPPLRAYLGRVSKADQETGEFEVDIAAKWNGEQFAPFTPMTLYTPLKFDIFFNYIKPGDEVVCALSDSQGMIAIGLVGDSQSTQKHLSWMVGDPNAMPSPFIGNYKVSYTATPNCDSCTGQVCSAQSVNVTVKTVSYYSNSKEFPISDCGTQTMLPDDTWNTLEEGNRNHLEILFINGNAPASECPGSKLTEGTEPTSYFFIRSMGRATATPTATLITEEMTSMPEPEGPSPADMAAAAPVPGFGMMAAIFGCTIALVVIRR